MTNTIPNHQSSARQAGSVTRDLSYAILAHLDGDVSTRDLADSLPLLTNDWLGAIFTAPDERSDAQRDT